MIYSNLESDSMSERNDGENVHKEFLFLETESHYIAQVGLQLLASSNSTISGS
jgi:hypothetical protein